MKTIFITGANRGIGLGLTDQALQRGMMVYAACRNPDGARELWELESASNGRLKLLQMDVGDETSIQACARSLPGDTALDCVINNAGVLRDGSKGLPQVNVDLVRESFEINVIGPMNVTRALLPYLEKSKNPVLVNMTSKMGSIADNASGTHYAYRISKTALNMFTKNVAIEFPHITTICLHPGWVKTDMGGANALVDVGDATKKMMDVITNVKKVDTGHFLDFQGKAVPW